MKKALCVLCLICLAALAAPSPRTGTVVGLAGYDFAGNPDVTNLIVYFGTLSSNYTGSVFMGTNLSVSVPNLIRGSTYYFAWTAQSMNGTESDYSQELSVQIPKKPASPTAKTTNAQ